MRKIIASTFVTLDGIMQAPGGPKEDEVGGFQFGGWVAPHFDEEGGAAMDEIFSKPFELLLGRKTYDIFAAHWPRVESAAADGAIADLFNGTKKYVATRSPEKKLEWNNSETLGKDIVATLQELKAGDGPDLLIQGSSDMIQTLLKHRLIDEFTVMVFPVILGKGKRLFEEGAAPSGLKLISSKTTPAGVVIATYLPDGEVRTGSFELPDEE